MRRALVVVLVLLAACGGGGGGGDPTLAVESGTLRVRLATTTEGTGPVGFDLAGRFAEGDDLPVLDMTATRLLGDKEVATEVLSTGQAMFVTVDGTTYEVPGSQAEELAGARLGDMDVSDWVVGPRESQDGDERRITGGLDLAAMLGDLAAVEARLGGGSEVPQLDDDAAERLRGLVRDDEIEIVFGADDGVVRRVSATAELAGDVPPELREALGRVANPRIEVLVELSDVGADVEVTAPADAEPLPR